MPLSEEEEASVAEEVTNVIFGIFKRILGIKDEDEEE